MEYWCGKWSPGRTNVPLHLFTDPANARKYGISKQAKQNGLMLFLVIFFWGGNKAQISPNVCGVFR